MTEIYFDEIIKVVKIDEQVVYDKGKWKKDLIYGMPF